MANSTFLQSVFKWLAHGRTITGDLKEIACSADGKLLIDTISSNGIWLYPSTDYILTYRRVISNSSNSLLQIIATNEGTSKGWFMIFNNNTLPVTGSIPRYSFPVTSGATVGMDQSRAILFDQGISWAISSTANTLTLETSAIFRVTAETTGTCTPINI